MGIIDKLKDLMRIPDDDEDEQDEEVEVAPARRTDKKAPLYDEIAGKRNKVVNIAATTQLQVVLVKPEKFDDATAIADHLSEKRTVVLNLESTSKEVSRRLIDFLSGVTYAYNGDIKMVANNTFMITPYNVGIIGGDILGELENNGLYYFE